MINIAKQIYVGCNLLKTRQYELIEAEITPTGNSSNEKKKLQEFQKNYTDIKQHDNVPLPGFTLYKNNKHHYGSTDSTWLIIDPRGFLVRITNDNLEDILHVTGITEGLIQEKCVWARENNQTRMTLVPISSATYTEAVDNTELIESRVKVKDVQIGDTVLLQNKMTGIYMGIMSLYSSIDFYGKLYTPVTLLRRQVIKIADNKYYYQSDLKILKILNKSVDSISKEDSVKSINDEITRGVAYLTSSSSSSGTYFSSRDEIKHVSTHAVVDVGISLEEIMENEARILIDSAVKLGNSGMVVLEDARAQKYIIKFPYIRGTKVVLYDRLSVYKIKDFNGNNNIELINDQSFLYSSDNLSIRSFDNFVKFYKIVKHVKNDFYI